jgi:hypothetical protein
MTPERVVIPGVVRNGVVVPRGNAALPEGAEVEITLTPPTLPAEFQAEMDDWERLGDEAWRMIDQWEREDKA